MTKIDTCQAYHLRILGIPIQKMVRFARIEFGVTLSASFCPFNLHYERVSRQVGVLPQVLKVIGSETEI